MTASSVDSKILFVHPDPSDQVTPFIKQDLLFLRKWYSVEELSLNSFSHIFRDTISSPSVWKSVLHSDAVFGWFGWCAPVFIIASILGKPSVIVSGGADVVSLPEIGYGLDRSIKWRYYLKTLGLRLAKRVLAFSESSRRDLLCLPGIKSNRVQTLYLCVDTNHFKPSGTKKRQVLTVGYINEPNFRRKGFHTFLEAAKLTPEIPYRIAGKIEHKSIADKIRSMSPPNVAFLGELDDEQLLAEYQSAKVYAQLSHHEGFGVAIAEAMACECVPVVTNKGSIPEVVGNTGFYVEVDNPVATSKAIKQAIFSNDDVKGNMARQRVVELFPISKREEGIKSVIETLI